MSILSLLHDRHLPWHKDWPASLPWAASAEGAYVRLLAFHPSAAGLTGVGGVYVLWHKGAKPGWIYAGQTDDLGSALEQARDTSPVLDFESQGGIFATWCPVKEEYRDGVVRYLRETLKPAIEEDLDGDYDADAEPIPVTPPA